ncbi:hypothetical protein NLO29_17450, partial [Escherichia coli]|nr:hypothetical protein [Escherichia coli]
MDLYIQIIVVACLTGMTSLLAHRSAAVFHDGIRPILPQLIEGYMNRREAGSIAFGLSIGFVASVGISFTLKTGLLNAWLLFLPTDILGVLAINSLMAFGLGAIWGILILTCLLPVNQLLTALPVDVLGSLGELSSPVVSAFALFPLVAIFYQFGWKQSLIAAVVVLMTRVVVVRYSPHLNPESIEIFIGMVMLLGIAITHDLRHRDENDIDASGMSVFEERTSRIIKNLPYIAIVGALIAAVASMKIFAGSEVSIFTLEKAYSAGVTPEQSQTLINQAALAALLKSGQRLLVHDAPVYPTTRVIIEQMGLTLITADFNDLSALKQVVDEQQPDAALVQHTRQQPQDRYVLADVLATLRAAGVPALTDDNYAVMKVARIGCECGANVSTFSCFKLFGPEGVGAVVGDADVISRIRATLYSGGSQIQGAQALEVLRGLVLAPVMHAVQAGVSERLLALLNGGAVAEVKSAVIANAQSKVLIVEFHQPIAARV